MEQMTIQLPEPLTVEYLEDHVNDPEMAEYIDGNYYDILDSFDLDDITYACNAMATCILNAVEGTDRTQHSYNMNKHVINIARIGLNAIDDPPDGTSVQKNHIILAIPQAELLAKMGVAMLNCNRPLMALNYLDSSKTTYQNLKVAFKKNDLNTDDLDNWEELIWGKEAETYLRLVDDLPLRYRHLFGAAAHSYLIHAINNLDKCGDSKNSQHYATFLPYALNNAIKYPCSNEEANVLNVDTITDDYVRWCEERVLFLNIFNEIPHHCADLAKDDVYFELNGKYQLLLDDILQTYSHCRKRFYSVPTDAFAYLDKERDEDVECLIDCYARLYTLLDKMAKLIIHMFPQDYALDDLKFWTVANSYSESTNPYLKAISHICSDIFPDKFDDVHRTFDPRTSVEGLVLKKGFIRNCIMHNVIAICKDRESREVYEGVSSITAFELYHSTLMMFYDVREVLLTLQLAVEYRRNE